MLPSDGGGKLVDMSNNNRPLAGQEAAELMKLMNNYRAAEEATIVGMMPKGREVITLILTKK